MLLVGLLISTLAARVRAQAEAARRRERRTQVALRAEPGPGRAHDRGGGRRAAARHVSEILQGPAEVLLPGAGRAGCAGPEAAAPREPARDAVAQWAFDHGRPAGLGTDTLPGAAGALRAARGSAAVLGVLGVRPARRRCCRWRRTSSTCWRPWPARRPRAWSACGSPTRPSRPARRGDASGCAARC